MIVIGLDPILYKAVYAFIGISLFQTEQVRDLGDVVMPYFKAVIFGVCTTIVFIFFGITFNK